MQSAMGRQQQHTLEKIDNSDEDENDGSDTAVLHSDRGSKVKLTPPTPSDGSPPTTPNGLVPPPSYRTAPTVAQTEYNDDKGAVIV